MAWGVTPVGKASGEDAIGLGTQAWNIADGYTKIKILRLLIQLDLDEEIALFGRKDQDDLTPFEEIPYKRVEAFQKFKFHLEQIIGNCKFAIEKGYDDLVIERLINRIRQVEVYSSEIYSEIINDITHENELKINEAHFRLCFNILRSIKDELNFPVNRAGLIFRQGEELDLDAIMRNIEEGG